MVKRRLVVFLLLLLTGGVLLTRAHGEDSSSTIAAQIEGRQLPNRRELGSFTLQEIMQYRVPGVSAVINGRASRAAGRPRWAAESCPGSRTGKVA